MAAVAAGACIACVALLAAATEELHGCILTAPVRTLNIAYHFPSASHRPFTSLRLRTTGVSPSVFGTDDIDRLLAADCSKRPDCASNQTRPPREDKQEEREIVRRALPCRPTCVWPLSPTTFVRLFSFPAFSEEHFSTPPSLFYPSRPTPSRSDFRGIMVADAKSSHSRNPSNDNRPSLNTQQPDPNAHIAIKGAPPKGVLKKRSADEHTALLATQRAEAAAAASPEEGDYFGAHDEDDDWGESKSTLYMILLTLAIGG